MEPVTLHYTYLRTYNKGSSSGFPMTRKMVEGKQVEKSVPGFCFYYLERSISILFTLYPEEKNLSVILKP